MNNYRRKVLNSAETALDDIHNEILVLAADEATGQKESIEDRDNRVKGWQGRLETATSDIQTVRDEEEEAAENTRDEAARDEKMDAVNEMDECLRDLEELSELEDLGQFNEMWSSKYDSMVQNLQNASQ